MITPLSQEDIKKIHSVEFFRSLKASHYGGLSVFVAFLKKSNLKGRLEAIIGERATTAFLQVMLGVFLGARSMEEISKLTKDPIANDYIGHSYDATSIPRILKNLNPAEIQALHEFSLSLGFLDIAGDTHKGIFQTLDIDATGVEKYGRQEGVEYGYLESENIAKCYQYLFIRNDKLGSLLTGTIRGGAAHSQNNFVGYLKGILPAFDGQWSLRIRADSGYFNEEAFEECSRNKVYFFIKAPMSEARRALAGTKGLEWTRPDPDSEEEFSSYETVTKEGWQWREVFKRQPKPETRDGYTYQCIATNDLSKKDSDCFSFYNGRALIENQIRELKEDYALGSIVTKSFAVNDVITQATVILSQLVKHFTRHCLDKVFKNSTLKSLRRIIFHVPAEILRTGRKQWYRVYNPDLDVNTYGRIFARIEALATLLIMVPYLDSS